VDERGRAASLNSDQTEHPGAPPEPVAPAEEPAQPPAHDVRWHLRRVRVYSSTTTLVATTVILVGLIAANTRRVTISCGAPALAAVLVLMSRATALTVLRPSIRLIIGRRK
jgi:hypothetical protein